MSAPVSGRSPDGAGLVGLRPEPASGLGHSATIPSAVKLTANEAEALRGLLGSDVRECFYPFKRIQRGCDLAPYLIRRTVRALARKGVAQYERGLWNDDGPAGSGYALTKAGRELADSLGLEASDDC